jgi:hypothetical protein
LTIAISFPKKRHADDYHRCRFAVNQSRSHRSEGCSLEVGQWLTSTMAAQGQQDKTITKRLPSFWESTHGKRRAGADGLLSNGWWELKGMLRGVAETLRSENEWLL